MADFLMEPFDVFKYYVALKAHFSSEYDFIKYSGKINVSYESFQKRKDRPFFNYVAKIVNKKEVVPFFVSQFIDSPNLWIGEIAEEPLLTEEIFKQWKLRVNHLQYNYKMDMTAIANACTDWKTVIKTSDDHSLLFKLTASHLITPETYTLLNDLFGHIKLGADIVSDQYNYVYLKYRPFLMITSKEIADMTPRLLTDVRK